MSEQNRGAVIAQRLVAQSCACCSHVEGFILPPCSAQFNVNPTVSSVGCVGMCLFAAPSARWTPVYFHFHILMFIFSLHLHVTLFWSNLTIKSVFCVFMPTQVEIFQMFKGAMKTSMTLFQIVSVSKVHGHLLFSIRPPFCLRRPLSYRDSSTCCSKKHRCK